MMPPNNTLELLPFKVIGMVCVVVVGGGIVYFVIRDAFRFGRKDMPVTWAIAMIALFTAVGFWATRYVGLLVAPVLGFAYALGRRRAQEGAAAEESPTPSGPPRL